MKCPYRVKKTTEIKNIPSEFVTVKENNKTTTEHTDFEDCYEILCPCFDSEKRRCNYGRK